MMLIWLHCLRGLFIYHQQDLILIYLAFLTCKVHPRFQNCWMIHLQHQYKTLILFVIPSKMLQTPNDPAQQSRSGSKHESYLEFSVGKQRGLQSQSKRNIKKTEQTQPTTSRENNEEPFYFKLSNSNKQPPQRRIQSKPELINIQNMKRVLNHNYSEEISKKHQQRRIQQRKKIMEERDLLSHFEKHDDFERRRLNKIKSDYNKNQHEQLNKKIVLMEISKSRQRQVDLSYKPRQDNLVHKAESWRNFYQQAYSYRDNIQREYDQYMQVEKSYEQKRNKNGLLNLLSDRKDYGQHRQFERHMRQHQTSSLKNILDKQIHDKAEVDRSQKVLPSKTSVHRLPYNPIVNPIDYKIDLNNKYLLKQIAPKKFFL